MKSQNVSKLKRVRKCLNQVRNHVSKIKSLKNWKIHQNQRRFKRLRMNKSLSIHFNKLTGHFSFGKSPGIFFSFLVSIPDIFESKRIQFNENALESLSSSRMFKNCSSTLTPALVDRLVISDRLLSSPGVRRTGRHEDRTRTIDIRSSYGGLVEPIKFRWRRIFETHTCCIRYNLIFW